MLWNLFGWNLTSASKGCLRNQSAELEVIMRMQDKIQALEVVREVLTVANTSQGGTAAEIRVPGAPLSPWRGEGRCPRAWFSLVPPQFGDMHPIATALRRTAHVCPSLTFEIQRTSIFSTSSSSYPLIARVACALSKHCRSQRGDREVSEGWSLHWEITQRMNRNRELEVN